MESAELAVRLTKEKVQYNEQNEILSYVKPLLLCFSHLRWEFVYQRPQHLMSRQARAFDVVFVEEPMISPDLPGPVVEMKQDPSGVRVVVPFLPDTLTEGEQTALQRKLVDTLVGRHGGGRLVTWYYTPMALSFSRHLDPDLCVYDCMDELSGFKFAPPELLTLERELFARADLVFTGGQSLYEAKRHCHADLHAFPSSIDFRHFARARQPIAEPADQAGLPRPRLGYFGVIDERMDLDLIGAIAAARPDWQLVMVGPVVKVDFADLPQAPNIHWLGGRDYADLPRYIAGWDVALLPFARNQATRFVSPTKTPEYLAAGRPVVSTPITDVVRPYGDLGLVAIADGPENFVAAIEAALAPPDPAWLARVDAFLKDRSWDRTWGDMLGLMQARLDRRRGGAAAPAAAALAGARHV